MARHPAPISPFALRGRAHRALRDCFYVLLGVFTGMTCAAAASIAQVEYVHPEPAEQQLRHTLSGSVVEANSANLSPAVAGLVIAVQVQPGDRVSAGDLLLELDPELAELALQQAQAALQAATIQLQEAQRLRQEGERLAKRGDLSRSQQDARIAEHQRLLAEHQRLQAAQDERKALLSRHQLKAPFDGIVVTRHTAPGEWINPGTTVLRLVGNQAAQVHVHVASTLRAQLNEGDVASIHRAVTDAPITARIARISDALDPVSRTALVRLTPDARSANLLAGEAVTVDLFPGQIRNAVSIPNDAVLRFPDGSRIVWVLQEQDGKTLALRRRPELGNSTAEQVLVLDGLSTDDRVVVRGNEALKDEQVVQASRFGEPSRTARQP